VNKPIEKPIEKPGELNRRYSDSNNHDGFSSVLGIFLPRPTIKIIPEFAKTLKWLRDPSTKVSTCQFQAINQRVLAMDLSKADRCA
jgi:hypothetical protein